MTARATELRQGCAVDAAVAGVTRRESAEVTTRSHSVRATPIRNLTCCLRGRIWRNPRRAEEMQRARREQAPAPARPREFRRDHKLDPISIRPRSFVFEAGVFNANFASLDAGQRRFERPRNDELARSVWRRTFNSGQGHQSRPVSHLFPRELDRAICSCRGAVWRP